GSCSVRAHCNPLREAGDEHRVGPGREGGLVRRRTFLSLPLLAVVSPDKKFSFPRDHGAHPDFRTEWWYLTGWLEGPIGFQVTFFRFRPEVDEANPSAFNPRRILVAHAALADPKVGHLVHEERAARAGFSLAEAETARTGVWIDDWRLDQHGDRYDA